MYYRGNLGTFDAWHGSAKTSAGIPSYGKIGRTNGVYAPNKQRTISYSKTFAHPENPDDLVWMYRKYPDSELTPLTDAEVIKLGWSIEDWIWV